MISYYNLGPDEPINRIVYAGSHDAGITSGSPNVQTQFTDVFGQAKTGVRLFDLRIAAMSTGDKTGGTKNAQLRAFHADGLLKKDETKTRFVPELGRTETITRTKLRGGGFGLTHDTILAGARVFVENEGASEFLMLKFDKCTNWPLIAEACVNVLGDAIYTGGGNLNKKTQRDLRGKVIVLFMPEGLEVVQRDFPPKSGILGIRNLAGGDPYEEDFDGLQYYGKGGTSPFKPFMKISQNVKKQKKLMKKGGHGNPDVMGMMYWTTTGLLESIRDRNDTMWTAPNKAKLRALWNRGMGDSIRAAAPDNVDLDSFAAGSVIKTFMPNFVMIDFADANKCDEIYQLNNVPATELVGLDDAAD
ncbi:hypothetical protein GCM10011611_41300 [Aliidongia dinghuensis]|uniref:Uncharacterized protein n=1 Tax=Aliidongia dinghuensis TaxID=1867774 RepID=A0A8J2YWU8_9PROT|nr:hypothetical protein [Aliidongia dinghuensis]GGF30948.1 hypothetical protein GCM10011611_41300 [Aliidongia dinghuensis]